MKDIEIKAQRYASETVDQASPFWDIIRDFYINIYMAIWGDLKKDQSFLDLHALPDSSLIAGRHAGDEQFTYGKSYQITDIAVPARSNDPLIKVRDNRKVSRWMPALYFRIVDDEGDEVDLNKIWENDIEFQTRKT